MNGPVRDQRLELLERRLASAERELAAGRRRGRRRQRRRGMAICGALLMAFRAPAAGPEPLTVKAPFVVLDSAGRPLLEVAERGPGAWALREQRCRRAGGRCLSVPTRSVR